MIGAGLRALEIEVDYGLPHEKLSASLEVDEQVRQVTEREPVWQILPEKFIPSSKLSVEAVLFYLDADEAVSIDRVLQRLIRLDLRPIIFAEFPAVLNSLPDEDCQVACPGSFWCPAGSYTAYRFLASENGVLKLRSPKFSLESGVCVPAVNHARGNRLQRLPMTSGF